MTFETAHVALLSELAVVISGYSPKPSERQRAGKYLLLGGRNIGDRRISLTVKDSYIEDVDKVSFRSAIARAGDIIVSTLFKDRKLYFFRESDPPSVVNNSCKIIRATANNDYILSYLRTEKGQKQFLADADKTAKGALIPFISTKDILNIEIPILPFEELQHLGDSYIQNATLDDLVAIRDELKSKENEVVVLQSRLADITTYYEDRLKKVETRITNLESIPIVERPLKVFLCHSSSDKPYVRKIYEYLTELPNVDPWLDEKKLLPGDDWQLEIENAVRTSDVVLVCLSKMSINKEGFVQKEIKYALDVADEKPAGTIFIVPLKIEECLVPKRLSQFQWLDYFADDANEKLLKSLEKRARTLGIEFRYESR
jgi:hypothetical protein